jgi:SAM-dependent methyltransferase
MPTSYFSHIGLIIDIMIRLKPKSILDVGVGYGKFGMLAREFVDYAHFQKREIKIDGIEIFAPYIQDGQRFYYDNIFNDDALKIIPSLGRYDLILILDVLEHFSKANGERLLNECLKHGGHLIIVTPLEMGIQEAVYGNKNERHLFQWKKKYLESLFPITTFYDPKSLIVMIGEKSEAIKKEIVAVKRREKLRAAFPWLRSFYRFLLK